ncbi:hypothetical protein QOZ80_9AG0691300 [Eleusine coracana subsp. coracana]|nr:hypothetical protein QOZ80_9AG0691300 [Eleusine coracana subsp. coracana]
MDTGDSPNAGNPKRGDRRGATSRRPAAGNPKRRDRRGTRAAASGRPGVDDGVDPNRAAGLRRRELMLEIRRECQYLSEEIIRGGDGHYLLEMLRELGHRLRSSETPLQASSSAAPPSDHPGADRTGSGTRVRQSVLYSNRPRRSRPRRPSQPLEHPTEVSSREVELEVANVSTFEAPSVRETSIVSPSETEEYPSEASISELGRAVTDLPTLEALSLRDSPLLTTQMTGEETDDEDDESSHIYMPRDVQHSLYSSNPIGLRIPMTSFFETVEELQRPDSDEDREKTIQIQRLLDARSPCTIKEFFDSMLAAEHAALTALAAEHGTEPPRDPFLVGEESQQTPQHPTAAAAQPLAGMTTRHKASAEENIEDGKKWMRDEVKLCFKKHIEKTANRKGLDFELDELCHQCFNVESYTKVFHHYNFKMRTKMPSSLEWSVGLYFAEVKEIFGRKFYFCCPLEPNESGHCYACKNQGADDLKHPATGGFEVGLRDAPKSSFWCSDEDE